MEREEARFTVEEYYAGGTPEPHFFWTPNIRPCRIKFCKVNKVGEQ